MKNIINFILLLIFVGIIIYSLIFDVKSTGQILYKYNPHILIALQKGFETFIDLSHLPQIFDTLFIKLLNINISIYAYLFIIILIFVNNRYKN